MEPIEAPEEMHDRLRIARKRKRLTQIALAQSIGVHEASIRKWEAGEIKNIQIDSLYQLCKVLDCRFEWLHAGEEPMCGDRAEGLIDIDCMLDMAEAVESMLVEHHVFKSVRERQAMIVRLYQACKDHSPAPGRLERFKNLIRTLLQR